MFFVAKKLLLPRSRGSLFSLGILLRSRIKVEGLFIMESALLILDSLQAPHATSEEPTFLFNVIAINVIIVLS